MKPESNRPIAIEDLLRLKRAERPPAEFWTEFDRKLRAKQLAALVDKRPWWQSLPDVFSKVYRYRIALGTTAICALTFLSIRQYSPTASPGALPAANSISAVAEPASPESALVSREVVASAGILPSVSAAPVAVATVSEPAVNALDPVPAAGLVSEGGTFGSGVLGENDSEPAQLGARPLSENLLAVPAADKSFSRGLLVSSSGFESRAMPARAPIEPLQQMTPPSESRRSRLLTAMVSKASLESSSQTSERAATRLISDERTFDQIHRFGARGDRVQVKF